MKPKLLYPDPVSINNTDIIDQPYHESEGHKVCHGGPLRL